MFVAFVASYLRRFLNFIQTRTRLILEKVWLEFETSGIISSVGGVQVWYSQHSLDHHPLECYWSGSWLRCVTSVEIVINIFINRCDIYLDSSSIEER